MKKILFLLFFLIASVALFAHTWEIRVKQNQNGTLTWYGQSYHGVGECGFANSGININGVKYNWTAEFSGSTLGLNASLFTVSPSYANCNCGRASYGTVTTPYIGGNLSVTAYSTNACYSLYPDMPAGNGAFIPPPPPVCTSCPLTGWGNTVVASGNNNGTVCNPNDDYTTATININHLSCASITGDKQFRVIFDPLGANVAYGPFNYSTGIQTNITINIPYGTRNSTPVKVIDDDFPCELTHGLSLPGGQYLGEKETIPPTIICPANITVGNNIGTCSATVEIINPTASDNCGAPTLRGVRSDALALDADYPLGLTTINWTATDNFGLKATCSQRITVVDNTPPSIICPTSVTVQCASEVPEVSLGKVRTSDNCIGIVTVNWEGDEISEHTCGSRFNIARTFKAIDAVNNFATCTQTITVHDNTAPVIICPENIQVNNASSQCGADVTFSATATDNCSGTASITYTKVSGSFFNVGTTSVTVTATDNCNNSSNCNFDVTITDNELPVITCPTPLSINTDLGVCGAKATFDVTATDNCSATVAFTSGLQSGSVFPVGSTTNVFTATDASGNTAICSFTVKVTDNELPKITCPTPLSISTDLGVCGAKATFDVTATDNCSATVAFTSGLQSGSVFPVGSTTNVFTATDASGNTAICSFTVKVTDNEKPVIKCPLSTSRNTNAGLCTYTVVGTEFNALATDNCRVMALTFALSGATTGTGITLTDVKLYKGTTTVTWTAVDAAGNTSTCSSTIIVNDDQNPTGYIIYATKEVKFGEYNYINGDIGVTAIDGKASFKKYDVLNPYFVKAKNIEFELPSSVANRIYSSATDGPNPTFFMYNGNTSGLSNYNVSTNTVLAGNYKDLTIKKGVVATIQGNNFGKISIEEGAQVTFTSSAINVEEMDIQGGKKSVNTTNVYFTNPSSVKVKDKVKIDADCRVNVNGPKITFYLGDTRGDEEKFTVKGDNSQVTANVMIPNGKLKVNGGESRMSIMTGWYIVEKLESTGKYITWNRYDCSMPAPTHHPEKEKVTSEITAQVEPERNVITFVSNQGTNTGIWTIEKRNEVTGTFEKLEIRNNAQLKNALQYHTFYDKDASEGENFYRVKLTYLNGEVVYSAIKGVTNKKINDFTVYPNPAIDEAWIDLKSFEGRQVTLVLSDMAGKPVQQQVIQTATSAPYRLDIAHLPTGLYLIKVQAQGKRELMRKIQITK